MNILKTLAIGIAALGLSAPAAMAEWQPRKPIDFVIMAGPGGGADQIARFIQSVAEKKDPQQQGWWIRCRGADLAKFHE